MNGLTVGFVGGGRIVRILLAGWKRAGRLPNAVVSDPDAATLDRLRTEFPSVTVEHDNRQAAKQRVVFLALHPPVFPSVLGEIKASLPPEAIVVSLAPRWTMSKMCGLLGGFSRLARVIPNAPSIVNKGHNPVCFSEQLPRAERDTVLSLLAPLGHCPEVAETTLEAYAIVAAMGPTYLWYQLYELVDLGCTFGLDRDAALAAVSGMVCGAADTMTASGLGPSDVMDLIPVKPLAGAEESVRANYRNTLVELHRKLTT